MTSSSTRHIIIPHSRPHHCEADTRVVADVLSLQMVASGKIAAELAETLRSTFNGQYAATTSTGTLALLNALVAVGVQPDDEIILPTYVCPDVMDAVRYLSAIPVLCDIDPFTFAPNAETIQVKITNKTKAVIVPHLFGTPADVQAIAALGIPVIEDIAQGLGARIDGKLIGTTGAATVLSFHAIKMISAGEGGAVIVHKEEAAKRLQQLHAKADSSKPSYRFPLSDISASLAMNQWNQLDTFLGRRQAIAKRYLDKLACIEDGGCLLPTEFCGHAWFRFPIRFSQKINLDEFQSAMLSEGIHVRRPVDNLLHCNLKLSAEQYPVAEEVYESTLSLPIYPALTDEEQQRVIDAFLKCFSAILQTDVCEQIGQNV